MWILVRKTNEMVGKRDVTRIWAMKDEDLRSLGAREIAVYKEGNLCNMI